MKKESGEGIVRFVLIKISSIRRVNYKNVEVEKLNYRRLLKCIYVLFHILNLVFEIFHYREQYVKVGV